MNLRTVAVRGGIYMVLRQGLGIAVSTVGIILLTRALGPKEYGIWSAAFAVYFYLSTFFQGGVKTYLVRHQEELLPQDYHQAFSLLLLLSFAGAGVGFLAVPFLQRWTDFGGFGMATMALLAVLPIQLVSTVPLAYFERLLDYRPVALIEFASQVVFYPVALPLAFRGWGAFAPVAGWWAAQLLTLGLMFWKSGYRPRLYWESMRAGSMIRYGWSFSAFEGARSLRLLVNPLIVGRYAGAEAVGQVALAIRIAEQLSSIVMFPASRLSISVLARLQEDKARLTKALAEGMNLQLITVGPLLIGFAFVAPWIIPTLLGPEWSPVLDVYPFIATPYLISTALIVHMSALIVLQRLWRLVIFRLVYLVAFAGWAIFLIPRVGLEGYGWAELAALPSFILLLVWVWLYVGKPMSVQAGVWLIAWTVPLFFWQLGSWGWISIVALILPLMWSATRRELLQPIAMVLKMIRRDGN